MISAKMYTGNLAAEVGVSTLSCVCMCLSCICFVVTNFHFSCGLHILFKKFKCVNFAFQLLITPNLLGNVSEG